MIHVDKCEIQLPDNIPMLFSAIVCAAARIACVIYIPNANKSLGAEELEKRLEKRWCLGGGKPRSLGAEELEKLLHTSLTWLRLC